VFLSLAIALAAIPTPAADYQSTEPAQQLEYFLGHTGLNAVAAIDADDPGVFIAAVRVGGNLLVVRARHPAVEELSTRIVAKEYFKVFVDLIATPTPAGKFFVRDEGGDGVLSGVPGAGNIDVVREDGRRQIVFNGDFSGQGLTATQYDATLVRTDAEYARLLARLLLAAHRHTP